MAQKTLSLIPTRGPVDCPLLQGLHWLCNASSRKLMFGSSSALGLWGQGVGVRAQIFLSDPLQVLDCISWCWVLQPGFQRNWVCLHLVNGDNGLGEDKMRKDIKVFWKHFKAHMSISVVIIVFKCPNHPWCEEFQWLGMHQAEIRFYRVREKNTRFFPDLLIELICSVELLKLTGYWLKSHLLVPPPPPHSHCSIRSQMKGTVWYWTLLSPYIIWWLLYLAKFLAAFIINDFLFQVFYTSLTCKSS